MGGPPGCCLGLPFPHEPMGVAKAAVVGMGGNGQELSLIRDHPYEGGGAGIAQGETARHSHQVAEFFGVPWAGLGKGRVVQGGEGRRVDQSSSTGGKSRAGAASAGRR